MIICFPAPRYKNLIMTTITPRVIFFSPTIAGPAYGLRDSYVHALWPEFDREKNVVKNYKKKKNYSRNRCEIVTKSDYTGLSKKAFYYNYIHNVVWYISFFVRDYFSLISWSSNCADPSEMSRRFYTRFESVFNILFSRSRRISFYRGRKKKLYVFYLIDIIIISKRSQNWLSICTCFKHLP